MRKRKSLPLVIAAPISEELVGRTLEYVETTRQAERPREHRKAGIELINELTRAGLDGFFLDSARELGLGTVSLGAVRLGLSTANRGISVFVRRFVGKFDDDQMRRMVDILERILIERPTRS